MKVHIVAACDEGVARHLAAMHLSLADTNIRHAISIFVLWTAAPTSGAS
jgi:hypothetical protein